MIQAEASEAVAARVEAEAKATKQSTKVEGLRAEVEKLQEDNSIIKEDLVQLEETHARVLEQMKIVQDENAQ